MMFLLYMMFLLTSISSGTTETRAMFRKPPAVKGRMYLEKTYHSRKSWFHGDFFVQVQVYYLLTWAVSLDHRCSQRRAPRGPPTSQPGLCWSGLEQPPTWSLFSSHWFVDLTGVCSNVSFSGTYQNLTSAEWQNHQTHGGSAIKKFDKVALE